MVHTLAANSVNSAEGTMPDFFLEFKVFQSAVSGTVVNRRGCELCCCHGSVAAAVLAAQDEPGQISQNLLLVNTVATLCRLSRCPPDTESPRSISCQHYHDGVMDLFMKKIARRRNRSIA